MSQLAGEWNQKYISLAHLQLQTMAQGPGLEINKARGDLGPGVTEGKLQNVVMLWCWKWKANMYEYVNGMFVIWLWYKCHWYDVNDVIYDIYIPFL
jgi:hypothetical protein